MMKKLLLSVLTAAALCSYSRGEQWIFLLGYDGFLGEYSVKERFPLPENLGKEDRLGFTNGLLYPELFDEALCREVYSRFGLE